ncbi:MAG: hypothetical protein ACK5OP_09000 [Sphingobacteriales bacterium]
MVILLFMLSVWMGCQSETHRSQSSPMAKADSLIVGGGCETCEYMYIGQPAEIDAVDTSEGWREPGQKLVVKGRVFQIDGKTPAAGILLYYWQTDHAGLYSYRSTMPEGARRHGHIRGWVRTDAEGRYALYTARPAPYPNSNIPAHIHMVVKEPGMSEYYIDDYEFDDDKLLTGAERKKRSSRGGTGVLRPEMVNGVQVAERNIVLGLNIPDHPAMKTKPKTIGLAVGEEQPSFIPFHAWGPDKGSRACPVCKYGKYQGIIYFLGANPNWDEVKHWLSFLEQESAKRAPYLKVYLVYGDGQNYSSATRNRELAALGQSLQIKHLALTYVPSFTDVESEIHLNKLLDLTGNVFVVYKQRVITDKFIDIQPTPTAMRSLTEALERAGS